MIRTLAIISGLIGVSAFGGMALSMAHDISFAGAQRVAPQPVIAAAMVQPQTLQAAEAETAQVIPAILESSGPHNRLDGKSLFTASMNAPAVSAFPQARHDRDARRDVVSIGAPVFDRGHDFVYASTSPVVSTPPKPAPTGPVLVPGAPLIPDFLIGVFR